MKRLHRTQLLSVPGTLGSRVHFPVMNKTVSDSLAKRAVARSCFHLRGRGAAGKRSGRGDVGGDAPVPAFPREMLFLLQFCSFCFATWVEGCKSRASKCRGVCMGAGKWHGSGIELGRGTNPCSVTALTAWPSANHFTVCFSLPQQCVILLTLLVWLQAGLVKDFVPLCVYWTLHKSLSFQLVL